MPAVTVVLAEGAEEIETLTVADVLVRAGCTVTIASLDGLVVRGSRDLPLAAHQAFDAQQAATADLVYLPGGMGSAERCRDDPRVQELIAERLDHDHLLAMICACPISLLPGDRARGRRLTCYPGLRGELEAGGAVWLDRAVVEDGCLITSQGPGTAMTLGLHLAGRLRGHDVATSVAQALLADPALLPWETCP